jgi:hypothetical protein
VIEILRFRLAPGVDEAEFLAADKRLQTEFAYQQPGLLRRTAGRGPEGEWVVIDLWQTPADADQCDGVWGQDEVSEHFQSLVDRSTMQVNRYNELD